MENPRSYVPMASCGFLFSSFVFFGGGGRGAGGALSGNQKKRGGRGYGSAPFQKKQIMNVQIEGLGGIVDRFLSSSSARLRPRIVGRRQSLR